MSRFVLDCSVTMAWCFSDEADDYADDYADIVLDMMAANTALVPPLWRLEVANVLLVAERRDRITPSASTRFLQLLAALPIEMDVRMPTAGDLLALGRAQGLSAYDGAYLELTMREGLPLASRDKALRRAAKALGVSLFGGA